MRATTEDANGLTSTDEDEVEDVGLGKEEQKHRFVVLRAKGHSYARIARELGVPDSLAVALTQADIGLENLLSGVRFEVTLHANESLDSATLAW